MPVMQSNVKGNKVDLISLVFCGECVAMGGKKWREEKGGKEAKTSVSEFGPKGKVYRCE